VTAIAQRDTLIKLDFVVLCRVCRQAFCLLVTDRSDRSSPIVVKLRFDYSSVQGRQGDHAILKRAVPKTLEVMQFSLPGEDILLPEVAQIGIVVSRLVAQPFEQALLSTARFEKRRDQRLGQAEMRFHRLSIAPAFEEVVVRAYRMRVRAGFIAAIREGDRE